MKSCKQDNQPLSGNKERGDYGENAACEYLIGKGYQIVERNFRRKCGEIDVIAKDGECLVFAEVKLRKKNSLIMGVEAVNYKKQCRIIRTARAYMAEKDLECAARLDVIDIVLDDTFSPPQAYIKHYEDAFNADDKH